MNNIQMNGMGGTVPMNMTMNNGPPGVRAAISTGTDQSQNKAQLNTYIYEYFLRNEMYDCAKALLHSEQPLNIIKDSPGRRRDANGDDGVEGDSKDDFDSKKPADLPDPNLPKECPESCFLYEWWSLFWDMFNAQRGNAEGRNVLQYYAHTQQQSRSKQEQQQMMLRGLRNDMAPGFQPGFTGQQMMRGQTNGMSAQQNELRQKAIQNNQNRTPQQLQLMAQQKQQAMQRDPSSGDGQPRAQSPASAENAPSPSKRPRLDSAGFNPQQQMPNGRGQGMPQQVGGSGPSNAIQAAHMQLANGIDSNNLTGQQFQQMPGNPNPNQNIAGYKASLTQHQQKQMPNVQNMQNMQNPGGPPSQGSPMMAQGQQEGTNIANYYNPGEMGRNGMQPGQPGQAGGSGGNHALQDYQMQLMLLEQQNKKRLMMARQEQDSMSIPRGEGGQGGPAVGANGQPFQGTSPQGPRSVNSPNPSDQIKRAGMNPTGIASPLPEGQSRGSPSGGMNFNMPGGQMDPNMNPQYMMGNGMANGMRPPSSHPNNFNPMANMTPQQMAMARQQQAQNWQGGPNGQMMAQPAPAAPQQIGTPQQRNMPPPSVPTGGGAAANTNGRTQPASPQQTPAPPTPNQANKANPAKKKNETKESKAKRAAKKGSNANLNAGATPSADAETAGATPTPATPITPVHPAASFVKGQNGAVQPVSNGQPPAPANAGIPQPDPMQGIGFGESSFGDYPPVDLGFANPNPNMDVLQDFDFDSFLHNDDQTAMLDFDTSAFLDNEIGAE